jgi:AAA+ ATPase superfamily predicted ATPase
MKRISGPPVFGENFYGRKKELQKMEYILKNPSSSVLLPGPRRIGKSSIVKEFIRLNEKKYKFIYLNLEKRSSILELCTDLLKEIHRNHINVFNIKEKIRNTWNAFSKIIPQVEINDVKISSGQLIHELKYYMDQMEETFEDLYKENFIFAFDEFSDFILNLEKTNISEVKLFLNWMRELRQTDKIRLIISGSINIISTAQGLNVSDLINDLEEMKIFPLNDKEIKELLRLLLEDTNINMQQDCLDYASSKLGEGIPFYIQLFADGLVQYSSDDIVEYKKSDIDLIYEKIVGTQRKEFNDLHDRLRDFMDKNSLKSVWKILSHLSFDKLSFEDLWSYVQNQINSKEVLEKLLKRLIDECYICKNQNYYSFVSTMLADWWKNNYPYERG